MQGASWVLALLARRLSKSKVRELGGCRRELCFTAASKMCLYCGSRVLVLFFVLSKLSNLAAYYGLAQAPWGGAPGAGQSWAHWRRCLAAPARVGCQMGVQRLCVALPGAFTGCEPVGREVSS